MTLATLQREIERLREVARIRAAVASEQAEPLSFREFFDSVFTPTLAKLEPGFVPMPHVRAWCDRLERHSLTATLSARNHLKSHLLYAYALWRLYTLNQDCEIAYFSFKKEMSQYHSRKIKRLAEAMGLGGLESRSDAESVLKYCYRGRFFVLEPEGVGAFKRGRHPNVVLCDDILADPTSPLELKVIDKITRIFFEELMPMPRKGGCLHVTGTPMTLEDLFYKLRQVPGCDWAAYPAPNERGELLWPERFPKEELDRLRRDMGEKAFAKEFLLSPAKLSDSFIDVALLDKCIAKIGLSS